MKTKRTPSRKLDSWRRHFRSGEKGQVIVITAFAIVVMFGIVGLAVDVGRMYAARAELGRAVDAAALAGVLELPNVANAETTAATYLAENEPEAAPDVEGDAANNTLRVDASKTVSMFFIRVLGINTATVSAHAKAGFGVLSLDAALVIDATGSMDDGCNSSQNNSGCPIYEAKEAAKDFKDILLGTTPDGQTSVGVAGMRGCYRSAAQTATAPMPTSKSLCPLHDSSTSSWVTQLIYNKTTLDSRIENIEAEGGSGTNVCGGLSKGWEVLEGPGNHLADENSLRYLVLLSDGDNNYYGHYTYQNSPASPHTYQTYPCRPPSSCSDSTYNVGGESTSSSNPCRNGTFPGAGTTTASDNFDGPSSSCPSAWTAGTGWLAGWVLSPTTGNDAPTYLTTSSPHDTSCHVRMRGTGTFTRNVNLSTATSGTLNYWAYYNSWESGDDVDVQVSTNGTTWTTIHTHTTSNTEDSYDSYCLDLSSVPGVIGSSNLRIRFAGSMSAGSTGDNFYVDTIVVKSNTACSSDGYQDGHNGSPSGCSTAVKRERQLDMETWALAKAIKADNVIIYTIGFGTCDPGSAIYTDAECEAQIGNTDHDNTADERLLKCMASSTPGTNNRYFYAANASALPSIFTQIAQQIAHRLIE